MERIALYRTLHKKDVDLIVLDEPTANLDPKISENIINRLLKPNYNKTVIVITHDFELAKKFDRIIGMKEGKIICDSPPQASCLGNCLRNIIVTKEACPNRLEPYV